MTNHPHLSSESGHGHGLAGDQPRVERLLARRDALKWFAGVGTVALVSGCGGDGGTAATGSVSVVPAPAPTPTSSPTPTPTPTPTSSPAAGMSRNSFASTAIGTIGYWLYTPDNATANMPLIVYLHGGGGQGSDLSLVIGAGLPAFLYNGSIKNVPAYVLMPQCPSSARLWVDIASTVKELIDKVVADKQINSKKVSLTGHSFGGAGTWNIGANHSTFFSALAPLSGRIDRTAASLYTNIPVWAFVGSADTIVDPADSVNIVAAINQLGGNAQIKVYAGATHFDVPDLAYKDTTANILTWLLSQQSK